MNDDVFADPTQLMKHFIFLTVYFINDKTRTCTASSNGKNKTKNYQKKKDDR